MFDDQRSRVAACLMVVHTVLLIAAFFTIAAVFEFPAVLREPPERILELFTQSAGLIRPTYYVFTLSGVTFIAMAVAVHEALSGHDSSWNRFGMVSGILAGLTQAIGFIRWVWFVPSMAAIVNDPAASRGKREAALAMFEGIHQFAGVAVGENLSFLFQGLWTIAVSVAVLSHGRLDRRLGAIGIASGASFVVYTLEQFGGPFAWIGELNVVFHVVWLTWLVVFASMLFRASRADAGAPILIGTRTMALAALASVLLFSATLVGV